MHKTAILVFAKAPEPGLVKTRLIPLIGEQKAAQLHSAMITHNIAITLGSQAQHSDVQLWCAPNTSHEFFNRLRRDYRISLYEQIGDDLGGRMYNAFQMALTDHDRAVIIGTDCPTMPKDLIKQAFHMLTTRDAVIVPAEDGGYVLLGLKKAAIEIFTGITWGGGDVYSHTIKRFQQLDLNWEALDVQWDVDRPGDLLRLARVYAHYHFHPTLRSVIAGLKLNSDR